MLKQLVSSSSQSKRRSRADLTAEMISAPLGDFRHTMHVGRGGDTFGDTSFLSSRSGEPPREPEVSQSSPKHGLLSRTFRSSKRSQSVNRVDKPSLAPPGGSPSYVKNAISLPYLNEEDVGRGGGGGGGGGGMHIPKSASSSPMKKLSEVDSKPANGAAAAVLLDMEQDERNFGELTALPASSARGGGGGMKHAESIMSFHIDLGPSMLGDILSVMEKKGWEEDDLGYEEGRVSEGHASPPLSPPDEEEDEGQDEGEVEAPVRPPRQRPGVNPYTPELRGRNPLHHHHQQHPLDSCSVSSSGSTVQEEKPHQHLTEGDADSARYSSSRTDDDRDFSFMDDEDDDEIRV